MPGKGWSKLPKGWTEDSVKSFVSKITKDNPEHPFTACVTKMKGKLDNPEAFCGATLDEYHGGDTSWRSKKKKKAVNQLAVRHILAKKYPDEY